MRIQRSETVSRWAIYLVTGSLIALCGMASAQDYRDITTKDVRAAGVPARGVFMVINGRDIGSSLVGACDTNQDQLVSASELNAALLNWFQRADTDSSGALTETELAAVLKSLFPGPQPPPGAPPPPEEMALHNVLAKKLMLTVDSNKDSWMTFQEALSFVSQSFAQWDADSNSSLDASEFAVAFGQLMPPPPINKGFRTEGGPSLNAGFDY